MIFRKTFLDLSSCSLMYVADAIYHVLKDYEVKKCSLADNSLKKFPVKMVTKFPNIIRRFYFIFL